MTHPLQVYLDKLERGEPFTSLLCGDGEFMVAGRQRTGKAMQNGEVVTRQLEDEMRRAFNDESLDIFWGTDLHLIHPETYMGQDIDSVNGIARVIRQVLAECCPGRVIPWVDGTAWDECVRAGGLGPLFKVLSAKGWVLCGNGRLREAKFPAPTRFVQVQATNAAADLDFTESDLAWHGPAKVFVLCMGLSAIPLAMRLRRMVPGCTVLDLGSVLDVFAGLGAERGWRKELYVDKAAWDALVARNLERST